MYKNYHISKVSTDGLRQYTWRFVLMDSLKLILDEYTDSTKETTRHRKFHVQNSWSRLLQRNNTMDGPPPLPYWVKEKVLAAARSQITFD